MGEKSKNAPFSALGGILKNLRNQAKESVGEVAGAVEIAPGELAKIENGQSRPSEDVLMLLISHFNVPDENATNLWETAGYLHSDNYDHDISNPKVVGVTETDIKIVYTDLIHVTINNYGVVMNFMQTGGPGNQPLAISRIGMSKEHAKSVLEVLSRSLAQAEQAANQPTKLLLPPNQQKPPTN